MNRRSGYEPIDDAQAGDACETSDTVPDRCHVPAELKLVSVIFRSPFCLTACAGLQEILRIKCANDLDQLRDYPRPDGLVAGPQARAGVTVEVLIEEAVVSPVGIGLECLGVGEDGTPTVLVAEENPPGGPIFPCLPRVSGGTQFEPRA